MTIKELKDRRQWLESGVKREMFVVGFWLYLCFKMKELKTSWNADSKESVERKLIFRRIGGDELSKVAEDGRRCDPEHRWRNRF